MAQAEDRTDHLFWGYNKTLLVGILPVSTFCSGQTMKEDLAGQLGLKPYVVHATFQFSGTPGKRNRLREWGLWEVRGVWEFFLGGGGRGRQGGKGGAYATQGGSGLRGGG